MGPKTVRFKVPQIEGHSSGSNQRNACHVQEPYLRIVQFHRDYRQAEGAPIHQFRVLFFKALCQVRECRDRVASDHRDALRCVRSQIRFRGLIREHTKDSRQPLLSDIAQGKQGACASIMRSLAVQPMRELGHSLRGYRAESSKGKKAQVVIIPLRPPNQASANCVQRTWKPVNEFLLKLLESFSPGVIVYPVEQTRERICSGVPESMDRSSKPGNVLVGSAINRREGTQPLTQLLPLILRLPLPRPQQRHHQRNRARTRGQQNLSPLHTWNMSQEPIERNHGVRANPMHFSFSLTPRFIGVHQTKFDSFFLFFGGVVRLREKAIPGTLLASTHDRAAEKQKERGRSFNRFYKYFTPMGFGSTGGPRLWRVEGPRRSGSFIDSPSA